MAEKTITNPDASKTTINAPDPAPATRAPVKGDTVSIVAADGKAIPAEVIGVRKSPNPNEQPLVDVSLMFRGEEMKITSSPYDESAKKCDSWSWPAPPAAAE
jgi:hypothetical protein